VSSCALPAVCWSRGISFDKLGHFDAAIDDFNQVLLLDPTNSVAYFNRGSTYDSIGMHDAAIADFGRALELDPGTQQAASSPGPDSQQAAAAVAAAAAAGGRSSPFKSWHPSSPVSSKQITSPAAMAKKVGSSVSPARQFSR